MMIIGTSICSKITINISYFELLIFSIIIYYNSKITIFPNSTMIWVFCFISIPALYSRMLHSRSNERSFVAPCKALAGVAFFGPHVTEERYADRPLARCCENLRI